MLGGVRVSDDDYRERMLRVADEWEAEGNRLLRVRVAQSIDEAIGKPVTVENKNAVREAVGLLVCADALRIRLGLGITGPHPRLEPWDSTRTNREPG
jgi:hypothetical protein